MNSKKFLVVIWHVLVPKFKKRFNNMYLKSSFWILAPKHAKKTTKNFLLFTYFFAIRLFFCYSLIHEWYKVKWISQKWIAKKFCYSLLLNIHLFLLFTYTWFGTKCSSLVGSFAKNMRITLTAGDYLFPLSVIFYSHFAFIQRIHICSILGTHTVHNIQTELKNQI